MSEFVAQLRGELYTAVHRPLSFIRSFDRSSIKALQLRNSQSVCQVVVVIMCGHGAYTIGQGEAGVVSENMQSEGTGRVDTDSLRIGHCSLCLIEYNHSCLSEFRTSWGGGIVRSCYARTQWETDPSVRATLPKPFHTGSSAHTLLPLSYPASSPGWCE